MNNAHTLSHDMVKSPPIYNNISSGYQQALCLSSSLGRVRQFSKEEFRKYSENGGGKIFRFSRLREGVSGRGGVKHRGDQFKFKIFAF